MDTDTAARLLSELGAPTRLAVVRLLVRAGPDGLVVGESQRLLEVPASTLSHHIAHLHLGRSDRAAARGAVAPLSRP